MIDQITGGFYGLAIGDALGAPLEFMTAEEIEEQYGQVETMIGGGWLNLKPGQITDDTNMSLCIARGIVRNPADPIAEIGREFVKWYETDPPDIGNSCRESIRLYVEKGDWFSASKEADILLGKSGGNGSLMRTLPIALAYRSKLELMLKITSSVSKMTHWDELADHACQVYNILILAYLKGQRDKENLIQQVLALYPDLSDLLDLKNIPPSGYVRDSLYHALMSFILTENFADCLIRAVNLGGDADSIGAIAGGLAGVYYGLTNIPGEWLTSIEKGVQEEIEYLSGEFWDLLL